jgi:hypothetical protein
VSSTEGGDHPRKARKPAKRRRKAKRGRPTAYRKEFVERARSLATIGLTELEVAGHFGVAMATLTRWMVAYPDFRAALKEGRDVADARVEKRLYERALGFTTTETKQVDIEGKPSRTISITRQHPPDTTAAIFWLKNRQPELWREKIEVEHRHLFNFVGVTPSREEWLKRYGSHQEPLVIESRQIEPEEATGEDK